MSETPDVAEDKSKNAAPEADNAQAQQSASPTEMSGAGDTQFNGVPPSVLHPNNVAVPVETPVHSVLVQNTFDRAAAHNLLQAAGLDSHSGWSDASSRWMEQGTNDDPTGFIQGMATELASTKHGGHALAEHVFQLDKDRPQTVHLGEDYLNLGLLSHDGGFVIAYRVLTPNGDVIALRESLTPVGTPTASRVQRGERIQHALQQVGVTGIPKLHNLPPSMQSGQRNNDGNLYPRVATEYIEGHSLEDVMRHTSGTGMNQVAAARIVTDTALIVDHANKRGVIHRDLKPANIMLQDTNGSVVVLDWDLAHSREVPEVEADRRTQAGDALGTQAYMPPDVRNEIIGAFEPSKTWDVYSLGLILLELVTGRRVSIDGTELPPIPDGPLQSIIQKATHADPDQRYATAKELAADLYALDPERSANMSFDDYADPTVTAASARTTYSVKARKSRFSPGITSAADVINEATGDDDIVDGPRTHPAISAQQAAAELGPEGAGSTVVLGRQAETRSRLRGLMSGRAATVVVGLVAAAIALEATTGVLGIKKRFGKSDISEVDTGNGSEGSPKPSITRPDKDEPGNEVASVDTGNTTNPITTPPVISVKPDGADAITEPKPLPTTDSDTEPEKVGGGDDPKPNNPIRLVSYVPDRVKLATAEKTTSFSAPAGEGVSHKVAIVKNGGYLAMIHLQPNEPGARSFRVYPLSQNFTAMQSQGGVQVWVQPPAKLINNIPDSEVRNMTIHFDGEDGGRTIYMMDSAYVFVEPAEGGEGAMQQHRFSTLEELAKYLKTRPEHGDILAFAEKGELTQAFRPMKDAPDDAEKNALGHVQLSNDEATAEIKQATGGLRRLVDSSVDFELDKDGKPKGFTMFDNGERTELGDLPIHTVDLPNTPTDIHFSIISAADAGPFLGEFGLTVEDYTEDTITLAFFTGDQEGEMVVGVGDVGAIYYGPKGKRVVPYDDEGKAIGSGGAATHHVMSRYVGVETKNATYNGPAPAGTDAVLLQYGKGAIKNHQEAHR